MGDNFEFQNIHEASLREIGERERERERERGREGEGEKRRHLFVIWLAQCIYMLLGYIHQFGDCLCLHLISLAHSLGAIR